MPAVTLGPLSAKEIQAIGTAVEALSKDGTAVINVGSNTFTVRFQDGFIGNQSSAAQDVISTIANLSTSPTATKILESSDVKNYVVNVTDNPYDMQSGGVSMFGIGLVTINTSQIDRQYATTDGSYVNFNIQHIVNHEVLHPATGMDDSIEFNAIVNQVNAETMGGPPRSDNYYDTKCFLAGTLVLMADGTEKPIEDINLGDEIMAFDSRDAQGLGRLQPKKVIRLFRNVTKSIINLRGLKMTPGHVLLSDNGEWLTIAEVLRLDRMIVEERKTGVVRVRARTGAAIGSLEDTPVRVHYTDPATGQPHYAIVRAGIPARLRYLTIDNLEVWSLARILLDEGYAISGDGWMSLPNGQRFNATPWPGSSPFETEMMLHWIISVDGVPYMPKWIADLTHDEEREAVNTGLKQPQSPALFQALNSALDRADYGRQRALFHVVK